MSGGQDWAAEQLTAEYTVPGDPANPNRCRDEAVITQIQLLGKQAAEAIHVHGQLWAAILRLATRVERLESAYKAPPLDTTSMMPLPSYCHSRLPNEQFTLLDEGPWFSFSCSFPGCKHSAGHDTREKAIFTWNEWQNRLGGKTMSGGQDWAVDDIAKTDEVADINKTRGLTPPGDPNNSNRWDDAVNAQLKRLDERVSKLELMPDSPPPDLSKSEPAQPAELREWWGWVDDEGYFRCCRSRKSAEFMTEQCKTFGTLACVREVPSPERVQAALDEYVRSFFSAGSATRTSNVDWHSCLRDWPEFSNEIIVLLSSLGISTEGV